MWFDKGIAVVDDDVNIFEFEGTLGVWVIRRLLGGPRGVGCDVPDVVGVALRLDDPRWDRGVSERGFVEVEDGFFAVFDLQHHWSMLREVVYRERLW